MEDLIASNGSRFLFAVTIVGLALGALVGVLWLLKHRGTASGLLRGARLREQRLAVLESTAVDARRRLVLVRRDDVEHLLLIGGPADLVLESRPLGAQTTTPGIFGLEARAGLPAGVPEPDATPAGAQGKAGDGPDGGRAEAARSERSSLAATAPVAASGRAEHRDVPQAPPELGGREWDLEGHMPRAARNEGQSPAQPATTLTSPALPAMAAPTAAMPLDSSHDHAIDHPAALPSSQPLTPAPSAAASSPTPPDRLRAAPITDPLDVLFPQEQKEDEASRAAALARRFAPFDDEEDAEEAFAPQRPAPPAAHPATVAQPAAGRPLQTMDPLDALFPPETATPETGVAAAPQAVFSPLQEPSQALEEKPWDDSLRPAPRQAAPQIVAAAPVARDLPFQIDPPSAPPATDPPPSDPLDMLFPQTPSTGWPDETTATADGAAHERGEVLRAMDHAGINRAAGAARAPARALGDAASLLPPAAPDLTATAPAGRPRPLPSRAAEPALSGAPATVEDAPPPSEAPPLSRRPAPLAPARSAADDQRARGLGETTGPAAERPADEGQRAPLSPMPKPSREPASAQQAATVTPSMPDGERAKTETAAIRPPATASSAIRPATAEPPTPAPATPDETAPAVPGAAAAEFAQKLANERRMPFEQRLARAAAQRAAEAARPRTPPVSAMGQVLYRDAETTSPAAAPTPARLPPRPEPATVAPVRAATAEAAKAPPAQGGDPRSAADILDAARDRVLPAARPRPPRIAEQPVEAQSLKEQLVQEKPSAPPGSFASILAAGADGKGSPVTSPPASSAQSAATPSAPASSPTPRASAARPTAPRATATQPMPRATPTAPPKSS
ncbi:hypothetical protein BJF92_04860 [Rhizobium rhizosphaerae]|uniref:Flagellar biosynthesis protein FliO n=1 Tax=Xaviernesmea rhizosphaerae TaxID=1672749 RepID=A0A1Q9AG27_9HYPH|nr:flagellar biosynthetic protein FliO [Xaviernesmea rhizosphaerae]OLP53911.1 hypothetical protein BJF92_04860 [Xaviernesmea rhizosphaerae]